MPQRWAFRQRPGPPHAPQKYFQYAALVPPSEACDGASIALPLVRWRRLSRAKSRSPQKLSTQIISISRSVYGPVISADSLAQGVGGGRGSKKSENENLHG